MLISFTVQLYRMFNPHELKGPEREGWQRRVGWFKL